MSTQHYEIAFFTTDTGAVPFKKDFARISNATVRKKILRRFAQLENGNFGDHHTLRGAISELRIDAYRVYYTVEDTTIVIMFCAGHKDDQNRDIERALKYKEIYTRNRNWEKGRKVKDEHDKF